MLILQHALLFVRGVVSKFIPVIELFAVPTRAYIRYCCSCLIIVFLEYKINSEKKVLAITTLFL